MNKTRIKVVRDNLTNIVYDHARFEREDITREDVEKVLNMTAFDVDPRKIMYIQNLSKAWNQMLFEAESSTKFTCMSTQQLCLYNRICLANLSPKAGEIRKDEVKVMTSVSVGDVINPSSSNVFADVFESGPCGIKEQACRMYCNIIRLKLFEEGTESVARLAACSYLLMHDAGYFTISEKFIPELKRRIDIMLRTGDHKQLCDYLMLHAII